MMKRNKKPVPCRTTRRSVIHAAILVFTVMAIAACNESGGSGFLAGGGIGGTGISVGQISGFGSIIVNDIDFDTRKAEVVVNGNLIGSGDSVVQNALALGMVVRVEGKFLGNGSGKADRIVFNENVKGPVSSIETLDAAVKIVVILGQNVIIDDRTLFKNTDIASLTPGDVLQISGWSDGAGVIQATYAANVGAPDEAVTVKGVVAEVNIPQKNLRINQLSVDFSDAVLQGFPADTPAAGQLVMAQGFLDSNGVLMAAQVNLEEGLGLGDAEDVEIDGIVTQFSSPEDFVLGTTAVQTDAATAFKGIEPNDIVPGARLLVKGALTKGRLLADEVIAKDKVNLEGTVESVDYVAAEISLLGLNDLVIHVNNSTKIFGNAAGMSDILKDQHVKILGYVAGKNKVEAAQVKVEKKASAKVRLQGPITLINRPVMSVFSVDIDTAPIPENGFETIEEGSVSRNEFFNLIVIGDTVGATGNLMGDAVEWSEIELLQE